jgi:hypothetical protein
MEIVRLQKMIRPLMLGAACLVWFHLIPFNLWGMPVCGGVGSCGFSCVAGFGGYALCSFNGAPCDVCNPAFGTTGECAGCTDYGFNFTECLNTDNTGGTCSWDGSCCQYGSAPAPELPAGAFWYFAVALTLLVLAIQTRAKGQRGSYSP